MKPSVRFDAATQDGDAFFAGYHARRDGAAQRRPGDGRGRRGDAAQRAGAARADAGGALDRRPLVPDQLALQGGRGPAHPGRQRGEAAGRPRRPAGADRRRDSRRRFASSSSRPQPFTRRAYGLADAVAAGPRVRSRTGRRSATRRAGPAPEPQAPGSAMVYTSGTTGLPKGIRRQPPTPEQLALRPSAAGSCSASPPACAR